MNTYPLVRIVDAPTLDAVVLYDCNDATVPGVESYVEHDGFGIGVPQMLGDPDGLAVDWDLRTIKVPIVIHGSKAAALAAQSRLARVLLRQRFWVFVQLDAATAPVWWHAYRSQPGEVSFDQVYVDDDEQFVTAETPGADPLPDTWQITLTLSADPWGYLERRALPTLTMGNDPSVVDPPAYAVQLPVIAGESYARPRLELVVNDPGYGSTWAVIAVRGLEDPIVMFDLGDDDGWVDYFVGPDTPASVTYDDAAYLNGTYRQRQIDTELRPRFVTNRPLPVGRYRMFLRLAARAVAIDTPNAQPTTMQVGTSLSALTQPATLTTTKFVGTPGNYYPQWVDCGTEAVGLAGLPADVAAADVATGISIHARLLAGAAQQVRFDALMLVRIEGSTRDDISADSLTTTLATTPGLPTIIDADFETFWALDADDRAISARESRISGGFPTLDPARTNTLVVVPLNDFADDVSDDDDTALHVGSRTATRTLGGSYCPEVLWMGDGQPNPLTEVTP